MASDTHMYVIVRLAVWTCGSRRTGKPVADSLDAGVRARAQAICTHHQEEHAEHAQAAANRFTGCRVYHGRALTL